MRTYVSAAALLALVSLAPTLVSCGGDGGGVTLSKAGERGRDVYLSASNPGCGTCHILEEAGSMGIVGPNLDVLRPDLQKVIRSVTQGVGVMPAQREILSKGQIEDLATYLSEVAGK